MEQVDMASFSRPATSSLQLVEADPYTTDRLSSGRDNTHPFVNSTTVEHLSERHQQQQQQGGGGGFFSKLDSFASK